MRAVAWIISLLCAAATVVACSPAAPPSQRIKAACEREYGVETPASVDCRVAFSLREAQRREAGRAERVAEEIG